MKKLLSVLSIVNILFPSLVWECGKMSLVAMDGPVFFFQILSHSIQNRAFILGRVALYPQPFGTVGSRRHG